MASGDGYESKESKKDQLSMCNDQFAMINERLTIPIQLYLMGNDYDERINYQWAMIN